MVMMLVTVLIYLYIYLLLCRFYFCSNIKSLCLTLIRRYDENFFQAMVTPSGSFMAEVAVTPDTDEVVGAITASMEIENQNEVRGIRGTAANRDRCRSEHVHCCSVFDAHAAVVRAQDCDMLRFEWGWDSRYLVYILTVGVTARYRRHGIGTIQASDDTCRVSCVSWRIGNVCPWGQ